MKEQMCQITLLPEGRLLEAVAGDSLYTLLLVAGAVSAESPESDRVRLERGMLSPAEDPAAEEAVFTPAELAEGWVLASQHRIWGDLTLMLHAGAEQASLQNQPLAQGYGMAFDVGNGTIAAGLARLDTMSIPLLTARRNAQDAYGYDMQDRLRLCRQDETVQAKLTDCIRKDMNLLAQKLLARAGVESADVHALTVAASCPLQHLLLGRSPLGCAPFPQVKEVPATEIGMSVLPDAQAYLLPAVSKDIGADSVAAMLAAELARKKDDNGVWLLIDFGVNSEVMIVGRGQMLACSVSSSALEGLGLRCGMSSTTGAITEVLLEEDVTLRTIRDAHPKGISGAGALSAVHALLQQGMLTEEGKFTKEEDLPDAIAARLRASIEGWEFVLSYADEYMPHDITITQEDVLHLQMAKATVRAACDACLARLNATVEDIRGILLAETYRANIHPHVVLELGMVPPVPPQLVSSLGNASWQGAFLALSDRTMLQQTEQLAAGMTAMDLQVDMTYAESFLREMSFPV